MEKNLSGAKTDYLSDLSSHVVTAFQSAGTWQRGEIYAGGWHLGTYYPNATYFSLTDWLGTEHLRTDNLGNLYQTCYNLPFGDGQTCAGTDASPLHFTGKERDSETGLDYFGARYYGSNAGRFVTVDTGPYAVRDPMTLNRYAYTRDNPLRYIDPLGKYFVIATDQSPAAQQYISTLLRSSAGQALVQRIAADSRPTFVGSSSLPRVDAGNGKVAVTNGQTTALPGRPGQLGGTDVKLDDSNIAYTAKHTGKSEFQTGLTAFTHELNHVDDMNQAKSFQAAAGAGAAGDAPSRPGQQDTAGGTAEQRAQDIVSEVGKEGSQYTPNADTDAQAAAIIQDGLKKQDDAQGGNQTPSEPNPK